MTNSFCIPIFAAGHSVPAGVTIGFAIILLGLIVCLALEETIHAKKSIIAGTFALISLIAGGLCGVLPFGKIVVGSHEIIEHDDLQGEVFLEAKGETAPIEVDEHHKEDKHSEHPIHADGHRISMPVYIPGIDWGVIAIILGSSLFVDVTSKSGLFTWIAIRVTKASRGDPLRLLYFYGVMTVVFSAVLNNVTAMIIVGSLTAVSLDKLRRREKLLGFLLIEGLLTNIGGLLTLISSVPNIIVGTKAGISFVAFFVKAGPYVLVATAVSLWLGARIFQISKLKTAKEKEEAAELVRTFDETSGIESWSFFWFGTAMLILFILVIATTSILPVIQHLEMGFVALFFAGVMLIRYKSAVDQFYRNIDWDLLGFFMALFVVIYVMEHAMVLDAIGKGLQYVLGDIKAQTASPRDMVVLMIGSAGFSSVTDNIPLSAMLANILGNLEAPIAGELARESGLWWSVIFGSNLGGNLTPIGSASTLVAVTIAHKHKLPLSFAKFVRVAFPFAAVQLAMAVVYALLFLR